jgi:hypothetical protein
MVPSTEPMKKRLLPKQAESTGWFPSESKMNLE